MVTIRYFKSATSKKFETHWVNNIAEFLKAKDFTREELLDLRFFKVDVLGEEIDTINGYFLNISDGEIEIFHGSQLPEGPVVPFLPYIIAALSFVAALVLTPQVTSGESITQSSTNKLGSSSNEARVNERIDDVFGYVAKHTPPLWQVPYRIGVDNQETEVLLLCVGRGKYDIDLDEIYDGYTAYGNIPKAKANIYEPGTHPDNGDPAQTLGGLVDQPIGIYRESDDLNASELLPPNDISVSSDAEWSVVELAGTATLTLTNAVDLDVDLQDYFTVGDDVLLIETIVFIDTGTTTLYRGTIQDLISYDFDTGNVYDISGEYEITVVTSDSIAITGTTWGNISGDIIDGEYYDVNDTTTGEDLFYTLDDTIVYEEGDDTIVYEEGTPSEQVTWYQNYTCSGGEPEDYGYQDPITAQELTADPDVGQLFDNVVGPITIYEGSEKIIANITSLNGFYKIDGTTYKDVDAEVEFVVQETDEDGELTGRSFSTTVDYSSNEDNRTYSVYQSVYIDIPYDYAQIYGRRKTDRDKSSGVSNIDKIEWTALYSFNSNPDNTDFGDVTLMHCVVPSNSQSRLVKDRKTNLNLTRKITQYFGDGVFGPEESYATDDFSQILIHTALDPKCGRLTESQINADGLLSLAEQITTYFGSSEMIRFGYDFDTTEMSYEDMFILICNVVNCIPYVQNGVYDAFFRARTVNIITSSNL